MYLRRVIPHGPQDPGPIACNILLVDDDPTVIHALGRILSSTADLRFATSGEAALRLAQAAPPDLILLDAEMPGMSGFDVCRRLKADPQLTDVPVIFVTRFDTPASEVAGLDLGAADYIAKPVNARLVLARVKTQLRLKRMTDELRRLAAIDVLTGVANRRSFDEALDHEWRRSRRTGSALSLVMIDIDHFKLYNDLYGHPAGDTCLRDFAQALLGASKRPSDHVARYGGEEFVVLLPQTDRAGSIHVAQQFLAAIAALDIVHAASPTSSRLTASIGVACCDRDSVRRLADGTAVLDAHPLPFAVDEFARAADLALYAAKHGGRARASLLDIGDVGAPERASAIPSRVRTGLETIELDALAA